MLALNLTTTLKHLRTGDLCFFWPPKAGFLRRLGYVLTIPFRRSFYAQVGIIEMREGEPWVVYMSKCGAREELISSLLKRQLIDIYRLRNTTNVNTVFDLDKNDLVSTAVRFGDGEFTVMKVKSLMTKRFNWRYNIWAVIKRLLGFDRYTNDESILEVVNSATVIEYAYNETGFDLCPGISPNFATVNSLSRSALLNYLFTVSR